MIRLLAVDVDGTLLDSRGKLPAENLDAVRAAIAFAAASAEEDLPVPAAPSIP